MKQLIFLVSALFFSFVALAEDHIKVHNFALSDGEREDFMIELVNEKEYTAFQMDIELPNRLRIENLENGEYTHYIGHMGRLSDNHVITCNEYRSNRYRIIAYSPTNETIKGNNGDLLFITIKADDKLLYSSLGEEIAKIKITNISFIETSSTEHTFSDVTCDVGLEYAMINVHSNNDALGSINYPKNETCFNSKESWLHLEATPMPGCVFKYWILNSYYYNHNQEQWKQSYIEIVENPYSLKTSSTKYDIMACFEQVDNSFTYFKYNGLRYVLKDNVVSVAKQDMNLSGNITIPHVVEFEGVKYNVFSISEYAFENTKIENVTISEGITTLGWSCFSGCRNLNSVKIPKSVTYMENYCFSGCYNLVKVECNWTNLDIISIYDCFGEIFSEAKLYVPEGTKETYTSEEQPWKRYFKTENIIEGEPEDFYIETIDGIKYYLYNNEAVIMRQNNNLTGHIKIPERLVYRENIYEVTKIGDYAFREKKIINIDLPNTLISIGSLSFSYCTDLEKLVIPNSVKDIGNQMIVGCSTLSCIIVEKGNSVFDSRENCNAIIKTSSNTLIQGCSTTIIPYSIKEIEDYAFLFCMSLTSINIPNSVTNIGQGAFQGCYSLQEIICECMTPPLGDWRWSTPFGGLDTKNIILKVPYEAVGTYKSTDMWKDFNIVGFEYTEIGNVEIKENVFPTVIYSLTGKKISETQKGQIYLFRYENGKTVKKLVK